MNFHTEEIAVQHNRPVLLWSYKNENHNILKNKIINTINLYKEKFPQNYTDSINVNVWQSNWEMQNQPGIDEVANLAKELTKSIATKTYNFPIFNPEIVDCWVNIYRNNSGCRVHQHFPATFSLVYYVQVPDKSGEIYFPDLEINLNPEPGLLLCFRGDLWHGVQFNLTSNDRIVIGINVVHKHQFINKDPHTHT